jgi:Putative sensor
VGRDPGPLTRRSGGAAIPKGATWRGIAYLLAGFPVGTFTFTAAVTVCGAALYAIAAPIVAPFDPIELGIWQPDSVLDGLALVPLGLVLLVAAGWISEGMAAMSRALVRWGAR